MADLTGTIRAALIDSMGPDRYATVEELTALGIPARHARPISQASKRITTVDEAEDTAQLWSQEIEREADAQTSIGLDPAALAAQVTYP